MGLTFATPNGGNSAMTGNRNKNNNASANKKTSNYSGGGGHPSAGGYGGGTKTKTTTPNTPPPGRSTTPNTPPPGRGGDGGAAKRAAAEKAAADAKAINDATKAREAQTRKAAEKVRLKAQADKLLADKLLAEKATKAKSVADENAAIEAESQRLLAESEALTAATAKIAAQKEQARLNLTARNRYQEMTETPEVKGNPNVAGNTYANAPTQFTEGRSGTSYYPEQAPDTMFSGLGIGSLVGKAVDAVTGGNMSGTITDTAGGPDSFMGGLIDAYSQFDPIGDFSQQTVYGMNDAAKQEYLRQEASNPNWQGMSEADRVSLARKPQMDNQLAHAYIGGPNGTQNEAQLNALRPAHMSEEQWGKMPRAMKMQLADHSLGPVPYGAGETAPVAVTAPVEEVVEEAAIDNSPWNYSFVGTRPEFSFAGRSGLSTFAEGGAVDPVQYMQQGGMASPYADPMRSPMEPQQMGGVGGLFQDLNRSMGMQQAQMGGAPLQVYGDYLNNTYTAPQAEEAQGQVTEFIDMVDQAERAHFGAEESFGYGGGSWQKGLMAQFQTLPPPQSNGIGDINQGADDGQRERPRPMPAFGGDMPAYNPGPEPLSRYGR